VDDTPRLHLTGSLSGGAVSFAAADLAALPADAQVADVGALVPGRAGRGVRLAALLERAARDARHLNIASTDPAFAVSVPIDEVRATAVVVYELAGAPLAPEKGGPFRLLVPGHPDECLNVKGLARLELSPDPGRDTRPKDDAEHAALHRKKPH
jgi:DMSO/TMAO reductase YedYZ molybdopterin-dependent catalytic subunit